MTLAFQRADSLAPQERFRIETTYRRVVGDTSGAVALALKRYRLAPDDVEVGLELASAYEQAASTPNVGTELKIRSLVAAGQCRDLNGERHRAIQNYQAAIDAGPNTSRADTARKYLNSPYRGA